MSDAKQSRKERVFTVELNSGSDLRKVNVPNGTQRILVEGTIGTLEHARFVEDTVLELVGSGGVLRVDLAREDLEKPSRRELESDSSLVRCGAVLCNVGERQSSNLAATDLLVRRSYRDDNPCTPTNSRVQSLD